MPWKERASPDSCKRDWEDSKMGDILAYLAMAVITVIGIFVLMKNRKQ